MNTETVNPGADELGTQKPRNPMLWSLGLAALSASACCPAKPAPAAEPAPTVAQTAAVVAPPASPAPAPTPKPKTVVVFVIDQLGSWVLDKYLPHLDPDGAIRTGVDRGLHADVAYGFASTRTAPGHAAIMTGMPPSVTGVTSNRVILKDGGHRSFVSDGKHRVLGRADDEYASPVSLRVPTIGDALHEATGGTAKIIAISGKDRSAVISGGQHADLALWYDYKIPAFTSSTFYGEELPAPIASWLAKRPINALLVPWEAESPELYEKLLGPDEGPGEGDYMGFGTTFPHDPKRAEKPFGVLRLMPSLTEYTMELAAQVAAQQDVGGDDVIDLLIVSISGTDYVGHSLGAMSWEAADQLIRADRAMGKLVRELEKRGPVAVLITADHGVAPLPDKNPGNNAVRHFPADIEKIANDAVVAELGKGAWVTKFSAPFLYLKQDMRPEDQQRAIPKMIAALEKKDGIHGAYSVAAAKTWREDPDPVKRAVSLSIADDTVGALYVLPAEGCIMDEDRPRGKGTTHGTPWSHDTHVPAIIWGPGIERQRTTKVFLQDRVAPTIARMLGIAPPKGVTAKPLPAYTEAGPKSK